MKKKQRLCLITFLFFDLENKNLEVFSILFSKFLRTQNMFSNHYLLLGF